MKNIDIRESPVSRFLFSDTRFAWFWLIVRLFVGYEWLIAGWQKFQNPMWVGGQAGTAIRGFFMGALQKTAGAHPDVSGWYGAFIQNIALPNATLFSYLITFGEIAVGLGLILGLFTGIAAFFGGFMNLNFLLAGTVSMNPVLFILEIFLVLSWKTAGWLGVDHFLLAKLGTPWQPGPVTKKKK